MHNNDPHRMPKMRRNATVALALFAISAGAGYVWTFGIEVKTSAESFVTRSGMPLFEVKNGKMNVRLAPTPAKWPEEAATMYRAASFGIPVKVELRTKSGQVTFGIDGLSIERDFLIPCASLHECRSILAAVEIELSDPATADL